MFISTVVTPKPAVNKYFHNKICFVTETGRVINHQRNIDVCVSIEQTNHSCTCTNERMSRYNVGACESVISLPLIMQ